LIILGIVVMDNKKGDNMPSLMNGFFRTNGQPSSYLYDVAGVYSLSVPAGKYFIACRGAGGAGGESGYNGDHGAGGVGGAGGAGNLQEFTIDIVSPTQLEINVGGAGKIYSQGGNGGSFYQGPGTVAAGHGGGGGKPSFVKINNNYYAALGGGGGGGGGAGGQWSRNADAGCGGGGGGFYRFSNGTITSVPGATGGTGGNNSGLNPGVGGAGNTTDFPTIYSGRGGDGNYAGANGNTGGGAGGGGGGSEYNNVEYGSRAGAGGGGAGGSLDASGGEGGKLDTAPGGNGYNFHTTPTNITAENAQYTASGESGRGGSTNQNGNDGFVYIKRIG
jgi:hypothetical protein